MGFRRSSGCWETTDNISSWKPIADWAFDYQQSLGHFNSWKLAPWTQTQDSSMHEFGTSTTWLPRGSLHSEYIKQGMQITSGNVSVHLLLRPPCKCHRIVQISAYFDPASFPLLIFPLSGMQLGAASFIQSLPQWLDVVPRPGCAAVFSFTCFISQISSPCGVEKCETKETSTEGEWIILCC